MDIANTNCEFTQRFLKHVKFECRRYGMKLTISKDRTMLTSTGDIVSGYFTDDPMLEIAVAIGSSMKSWLSTLVHEFSHFEQWRDRDPTFIVRYKKTTPDAIMSNWLAGKEYDALTVNTGIDLLRNCELNCERRSIQNIIKYKLPINTESYSKQASAYIYYFNYLKLTRRWFPPNEKFPSEISSILALMPSDLNGDYSKMSKELLKLYDTELGYH